MIILSDSVLVESKLARDHQHFKHRSHGYALEILNPVEQLCLTIWKKVELLTAQQLADRYQEVVQ